MYDARDIARHLVALGADPARPGDSVSVSPYRLQALLYYSQGNMLALLGRPLFRQPLVAGPDGPEVRDVVDLLAGVSGPVTPERVGPPAAALTATERAMLLLVWNQYAGRPAGDLTAAMSREPALRGVRPGQSLDHGLVAAEALAVARRAGAALRVPMTDPAAYWRAEEEADDLTSYVPAAEVFGAVAAGR